jgi:hypothetical protein
MQSSSSLSSISSTTSNNSSIYGSQTVLDLEDLPLAAPRCRSSIISSLDNNQTPRPSTSKCRHIFRTCLSSTSSPLSSLIQNKLSDNTFRKQYFTKLSRHHPLLFVLNDYQCQCGCHFSVKQGTFVILSETKLEHNNKLLTVISNQLIRSKIPSNFVCNINILRERVRLRSFCHTEQSFDL